MIDRKANTRIAPTSSFVLWGIIAGILIGLLDTWLGSFGLDAPIAPQSFTMLAIVSASTLVLPGVLLGLFMRAAFGFTQGRLTLSSVRAILLRPFFLVSSLLALASAVIAARFIIYSRGIQLDAINYNPLALVAIAVAVCTAGGTFLAPRPGITRALIVGLTAASLGIVSACVPMLGNYKGILSFLETETVALGPIYLGAKTIFDEDRDGFAVLVCESDCDCNDSDPSIHPAAVDVPDNRIDEDCSGSDLTRIKPVQDLKSTLVHADLKHTELKPPISILLITVDAMRADHMSSYGYERKTTPNLDRFAAENIFFTQARSQGPSTRHSFPVILTGRYFSNLKLKKGKKWSQLLPENVTFAEQLKDKGYQTLAIVPYFRFKERSGFSQGFDVWKTVIHPERDPVWDPTADLVTDIGLEHLGELSQNDRPWLIWLHYFDPHGSYIKHPNQESFGKTRVDRYDGELLYTDAHIQRLFDGVRGLSLWDRIAVIVTSDHGEGLGRDIDHGFKYHGFSLFDSEIRVPFMVRLPNAHARTVMQPVGLIDLFPTILDLAGVQKSNEIQGVSLVPYLLGSNPLRPPILSERPGKRPLMALVDWPFKIIWNIRMNRYSLYDLKNDPHELSDLAQEKQKVLERLTNQLRLLRFDLQQ